MNSTKKINFSSMRLYRVLRTILLLSVLVGGHAIAQTGQIDLNRVQLMPNLPVPYVMRNWKNVAIKHDELAYNTSATGQFLPLIHVKASGVNYPPLQPILLDTYVGSSTSGTQAEAINIIPSLVGASLMGINKSSQNGINWVIKANDFFNKANGQNVYLNGYSSSSGNDWWYDLMPNVFFYQLYSQYPATTNFSEQFTSVADRWLKAVQTMGGSNTPWTVPQMNYRAFNLSTMTPNGNGVIEPEASGGIAWILYNAWIKTGNKKYLEGAQQSMEFLAGLTTNPSYELQLPYGVFMAAKMNAELGTNYDINKMVNWCFDRGPLRGWGTIVGTWNGSNVSGLVGEANDGGNDYAFALNGFQQAAALVPMVKYDKRFARAIGKWVLNLSNASRFYYSKYLPPASQDDFTWSSVNDPKSVIAYEALKENSNGNKLYATGDAKRSGWAQTNLGLYGSSSVGYLAALVDTTNVSGILLLDVNKTDFFSANTFPSYLAYNPYGATKQVTLPLGTQTYEIYNAVSETIIKAGATGNTVIDIPANEAMLLVYLPQGSTPSASGGKLFVGNTIVDYHYGYNFAGKTRIKSLAVVDTLVAFNQLVPVYSVIENAPGATYNWYVNGILSSSSSTNTFSWTAPAIAGTYSLRLSVVVGSITIKDSLAMRVVARIPVAPVINGFGADKTWYSTGNTAAINCNATNKDGGLLQYTWTVPGGSIVSQNGSLVNWALPQNEGLFEISCEVTNSDGLKATLKKQVLVKKMSTATTAPFAWYPLDGNTLDYSGNGHNAVLENAQLTMDSRGQANKAYRFSSGTDIIYINNTSILNFQNEITLSFWVNLDAVTQESFILSHGSWEERWKVSVTPDKKMRWTVKTNTTTKDLDSSFPLVLNHFYHFTVVYTNYSMELYADGLLDTYLADAGPMAVTSKAITFGRKDVSVSNYFLRGVLDEVRIYDKALAPNEIEMLKTLWNTEAVTAVANENRHDVVAYPNPASGTFQIMNLKEPVTDVELIDITGRKINSTHSSTGDGILRVEFDKTVHGFIILKIETDRGLIYLKIIAE